MPYQKSFSEKQVPLKSSHPGWRAPGTNGNLVISFSDDDDSGSDAEEQSEKASGFDRPPLVLNSNRRPPTLPYVKMQTVSRNAKKEGKLIPKKVPSSRKSAPSMTKSHGSSVKTGASVLAEPRTWWKNSNVIGGSVTSQDPGCSKNVDTSSSKLEDLRQQIAARENELKLKLLQQNKENITEASKDANTMGQRKILSRKCDSVPADVPLPKEPDRKRLRTDTPGVNVSCSLSDWISMPKQTALSTGPLERSHPGVVSQNQPSRSAPNQDIRGNNIDKVNDQCDATSALKKLKPTSDSSLEACDLPLSTSKFGSPDVSPDGSSLFLHLGKSGDFRSGNLDLQSLFELEELHDKELEEAQVHRRKCEVEERNARNAYRRAQRAVVEANARCACLYRKRELYSTQLRSYLMEDPSVLYSSMDLNETEEKWNLANNVSEVNLDLIPASNQLEVFEAGNRVGYGSNVHSADGDGHNISSANEDGRNLGSEACSEPDASTSELIRSNRFAANGVHSPCGDPNLYPDDDYETFPLDHRSPHANIRCLISKDNTKESVKDMDVSSATDFSIAGSQDPLFLEEYLRSKLISRLGVSSGKHSGIGDNVESSVERAAEEHVAGKKSQMITQSAALSDHNVSAADYRRDGLLPVGSISQRLLKTQSQLGEDHCLSESPTISYNPEECRFLSVDNASTSAPSLSATFKSAIKALGPVTLDRMPITEQQYGSPDTCLKDNMPFGLTQDSLSLETTSSAEQLVKCVGFGKIDSYTCMSVIDPFWPLCMYELRGRCNNDECPWQHSKDFSVKDDCRSDWSSNRQSLMRQKDLSALTPPSYLVCFDSLEDELHKCRSLDARYFRSFGKRTFSCSLAVSSSIIKHLSSNEPCLHGNDGYVESDGGSGNSLYLQSRNGAVKPLQNGLADSNQSLELSLTILSQEVNKIDGTKKALSVLSRALEADPSSLPIWIIYLLLYYSTKYSIGELNMKVSVQEDDFFTHAVKNIEGSYELWLLYINSRGQLNERFSAYDRALSGMCHYVLADDGQRVHRSAAILDLFLQMLYCCCMSGNVAKAIQRIHRLVHTDGDSDESHFLLLSDILRCLTISDKCVFWICCVYLVVYRKLPDSLVQQFEFKKDVSLIEWPSTRLPDEEKQNVSKLVEMAMDSVGLHADVESLDNSILNEVHLLVVNHIKLMAAIDDADSFDTFEKYKNLFSSCVDLVLLSARAQDSIAESTKRFEKTISNWPNNFSGIQCIWNQYAEYAVGNGKPDWAKEIMGQWFHSARVPLVFHKRAVDDEGDESRGMRVTEESGSNLSTPTSNYSSVDLAFGLLNLSLYKLLQNDVLEAHLAIDKALKVADEEVLRHCIKEHAAFFINNGSQLMKDISVGGLINTLKGYIIHAWPITVLEPLTWKFIQDIQKPRTRQLVRNILTPTLPDSALVNSVLDIWFGSSLLPSNFDQLKDMVDFVEKILEISPANYQLVISVCKFVSRDSDSHSKSISVLFWASSLLVNTMYHAVPFPPERVWVEAADMLGKLTNEHEIHESFHHRALSVYPFSINLWKSFLNQSTEPAKKSSIVKAARDKGLEIE